MKVVIVEKHNGEMTLIKVPKDVDVIIVDLDELKQEVNVDFISKVLSDSDDLKKKRWDGISMLEKYIFAGNIASMLTTEKYIEAGTLENFVKNKIWKNNS